MDIVIEKTLEACIKRAKENGYLFSKRIKKNTETTKQEQNISSISKEIISPEPFAFKCFPANTMTKDPTFVHILNRQQ